jgi:mannose-6-phosphate isomerase-like protein (cupin superfamily)
MPTDFATLKLPLDPTVVAPDGSDVRVLLGLQAGGMAHFQLAAGQTARAVVHRTVEEVWYVVGGRGEMWRRAGEREEVTVLGTHFQFRASPDQTVSAVAITMPPWPGSDEAVWVAGPWTPSVAD